jgi:hypothetical protein
MSFNSRGVSAGRRAEMDDRPPYKYLPAVASLRAAAGARSGMLSGVDCRHWQFGRGGWKPCL